MSFTFPVLLVDMLATLLVVLDRRLKVSRACWPWIRGVDAWNRVKGRVKGKEVDDSPFEAHSGGMTGNWEREVRARGLAGEEHALKVKDALENMLGQYVISRLFQGGPAILGRFRLSLQYSRGSGGMAPSVARGQLRTGSEAISTIFQEGR
jgi:hypothetical protein